MRSSWQDSVSVWGCRWVWHYLSLASLRHWGLATSETRGHHCSSSSEESLESEHAHAFGSCSSWDSACIPGGRLSASTPGAPVPLAQLPEQQCDLASCLQPSSLICLFPYGACPWPCSLSPRPWHPLWLGLQLGQDSGRSKGPGVWLGL